MPTPAIAASIAASAVLTVRRECVVTRVSALPELKVQESGAVSP